MILERGGDRSDAAVNSPALWHPLRNQAARQLTQVVSELDAAQLHVPLTVAMVSAAVAKRFPDREIAAHLEAMADAGYLSRLADGSYAADSEALAFAAAALSRVRALAGSRTEPAEGLLAALRDGVVRQVLSRLPSSEPGGRSASHPASDVDITSLSLSGRWTREEIRGAVKRLATLGVVALSDGEGGTRVRYAPGAGKVMAPLLLAVPDEDWERLMGILRPETARIMAALAGLDFVVQMDHEYSTSRPHQPTLLPITAQMRALPAGVVAAVKVDPTTENVSAPLHLIDQVRPVSELARALFARAQWAAAIGRAVGIPEATVRRAAHELIDQGWARWFPLGESLAIGDRVAFYLTPYGHHVAMALVALTQFQRDVAAAHATEDIADVLGDPRVPAALRILSRVTTADHGMNLVDLLARELASTREEAGTALQLLRRAGLATRTTTVVARGSALTPAGVSAARADTGFRERWGGLQTATQEAVRCIGLGLSGTFDRLASHLTALDPSTRPGGITDWQRLAAWPGSTFRTELARWQQVSASSLLRTLRIEERLADVAGVLAPSDDVIEADVMAALAEPGVLELLTAIADRGTIAISDGCEALLEPLAKCGVTLEWRDGGWHGTVGAPNPTLRVLLTLAAPSDQLSARAAALTPDVLALCRTLDGTTDARQGLNVADSPSLPVNDDRRAALTAAFTALRAGVWDGVSPPRGSKGPNWRTSQGITLILGLRSFLQGHLMTTEALAARLGVPADEMERHLEAARAAGVVTGREPSSRSGSDRTWWLENWPVYLRFAVRDLVTRARTLRRDDLRTAMWEHMADPIDWSVMASSDTFDILAQPATVERLAQDVGLTPAVVRDHVRNLVRDGLLASAGSAGGSSVTLTEGGRRLRTLGHDVARELATKPFARHAVSAYAGETIGR